MLRSLFLRALIAVPLLTLPALAAFPIAKDKPLPSIVIRASAVEAQPLVTHRGAIGTLDEKVKLAAVDLQTYLEKLTGAKLPIVGDAAPVAGPRILVGASALTAQLPGVTLPSGLTAERVEEAYLLYCQGDTLVLAGNDDGPYQCTYYAVAEFLRRQGVRWILPGDFGEVVPPQAPLTVADMNVVERPSFRLRTWWCNLPREMDIVEARWKLRNKMQLADTAIVGVPGDSWLRTYMPDAALTATRPELFGRNPDGSPNPYMPNLTNPEAAKLVAEKVLKTIADGEAKGAAPHALGFAPDDGLPMDLTPQTMNEWHQGFTDWVGRQGVVAEASISEEWFRFMNRVTEEVVKARPGFIVTTNGYANRALPPEGLTLHPNLGVMVAQIWADTLKPVNHPKSWHSQIQGAELQRWCQMNKRVFLYQYNATMLVTALAPVPQVRKLLKNSAAFADWGLIGYFDETTLPYMQDGIATRYFRANLMWQAKPDPVQALADYYRSWYGPAAQPAAAFWEALETCILESPLLGHEDRILPYVYTADLLATLEKECAAAEALATAEPFKTRVRIDRLTLDHLKAYMAAAAAEFDGQYGEVVRQLDAMIAARLQLNAISPFLILPPSTEGLERYYGGEGYWGALHRKAYFTELHAKLSGAKGDLLAMAPKTIEFALDPGAVGKSLRWYDGQQSGAVWRPIDCTRPYYLQVPGCYTADGMPYVGHMWYRAEVELPAVPAGRQVRLFSPAVSCEAWVWVNGQYAGYRKYLEAYIRPNELDLDVTALVKPGQKNQVAVWVSTGVNRTQAPEGFTGRLLFYAPK